MPSDPRVQITITGSPVDDRSIKVPPAGRITLSPEARRKLIAALGGGDQGLTHDLEGTYGKAYADDPSDADWVRVEDTLLDILMPVRYVAGVPTSRREDTQANEIGGLTPLPLHEQRPGAWNFREPRP